MNRQDTRNGQIIRRRAADDARIAHFMKQTEEISNAELAALPRREYGTVIAELRRRSSLRLRDRVGQIWRSYRAALFCASANHRYGSLAAGVAVLVIVILAWTIPAIPTPQKTFAIIDSGVRLTASEFSAAPVYAFEIALSNLR